MAVGPPMLTSRQLNRAVLARQLLLERARMPLPRAVEQMAGIQNQYAPNAYIRLWSCLDGFADEDGGELVDLPAAPIPDADTPAPVRFLPTWDATLLVHARGAGILPERYRTLVFNTKTPHSVPTFLVDGAVAGTWRYQEGRVELTPFEPLSAAVLDDVEAEAARLAAFHA